MEITSFLQVLLGLNLFFWALAEWNLRVYRRFSTKRLEAAPFVSVLVPCRNEAFNAEACLSSLIGQDYPRFEVLAFNDASTDGTNEILDRLEERHARFKVIHGGELPSGWTGKNRACAELARVAKGEWILFVDADTFHDPSMLSYAMATAIREGGVFLSTFPRQRASTWGDALLVPLLPFILFSFLPMFFVERRRYRWMNMFSAACGQFLLFKKDAYEAIGGHEALKMSVSEAGLFAKAVKRKVGKILLRDGSPWVSCAMYRNFGEAFKGFTRSVFATMGGSVPALVFFLAIQTLLYLVPLITLMMGHVALSLAVLAIPVFLRYRLGRRFMLPFAPIFFHALSISIYNTILFNSFLDFRWRRATSWKGRVYAEPQS